MNPGNNLYCHSKNNVVTFRRLCEARSAAKGLKGQTEALEEVLDGSEAQTHKEAEKASSARIQTALLTLTLQSIDTFSCAFSHSLFTMSYISISRKVMYLKQLNFELNSTAKLLLKHCYALTSGF